MAEDQDEYTFKLIIFGMGGAGKTTLVQKYLTGVFISPKLTIACDFYTKMLNYQAHQIRLQIWDFGGEERFRFLLPQYSLGAHGGLFVFDVTNLQTLYDLPKWLDAIFEQNKKNAVPKSIPIIVVGTKIDLVAKRQINNIVAIDYVKALKSRNGVNIAGYVEVSSKLDLNVKETFECITNLMLNHAILGNKLIS